MLRSSVALLIVGMLVLSGFSNLFVAAPAAAQEIQIPYGNVIVVLEDGVDPTLFASASGVAPAFVYDTLITGFAANLTPEAARRLAQVPQVEGIFPDLPVDPTAQIIPTGVERVNAPRNPFQPFTNGSGGSVGGAVAVVDSGVAPLADLNVIGGFNCTSSDTGDWADGFGHGTHVAGSLGAINNNDGVVGVAPGVGIFAARMLNSAGSGSQSQLICALEAVALQGNIRVANLSLTTSDANPGTCGVNASALHQAICNLVNGGVSVVVAAGNFGQQVSSASMAGYPEVITVSAFNDFDGRPGALSTALCASGGTDDSFWNSSNYGSLVDIMGPGVCIRSYNQTGAQVYRSGTSMAAPHVSGALALYYSANSGASEASARSWLLGSGVRSQAGAGVTAGRSGEPVLSLGVDLPTPTPTPSVTPTVTSTPTVTHTPTLTSTPSATYTQTSSPTVTPTPSNTLTPSATFTPSNTPSSSPTVLTSTPTSTSTRTPTRTPTPPSGLGPGVVGRVTSGLNMRSAPSTTAPVVAVLPTNTQVFVTGYAVVANGYNFIPVSTPLGDGWVASNWVSVIGTATPTVTPPSSSTPTATRTVTVTPSMTLSPSITSTPSTSPTPSRTSTASSTPTVTAIVPTNTPTVTHTPSRTATTSSGWASGSTIRTTASVNMRSGAGTNFGVITVLPVNSTGIVVSGPVTATGYQWYQVNMGSRGTGWVASNYLALVSSASATPTRTVGPATTTSTTGPATATRTPTTSSGFPAGSTVRTTAGVNMRSGAGTNFGVLYVIPFNTNCTVISGPIAGTGYQWYRLNCGANRIGWIASAYLAQVSAASVDEAVDELPLASATSLATEASEEQVTAVTAPSETATETVEIVDSAPTETIESIVSTPTESVAIATEPAVTELSPTQEVATEIAVVEPQPLTIARIQRSEGSSSAQVLVDEDASTVWVTDGASVVPLAAFIADLDAPQYVSTVRWLAGAEGLAGTLYVSVSTDNENWTDLTIDSIAAPGQWQELTIGAEVQFIRFVFVNDDALAVVGGIAEIEIWP